MRDDFAGHQAYDLTVEFCQEYDQPAFDPTYQSMQLEEFLPAVQDLFKSPKNSIYLKSDGAMMGESQ
jgi:hypothetical protein